MTSIPLTPTGSRAEACQPLRVFCAAWQGRDHEVGLPWWRPVGDDKAVSTSLDSGKAPDCPVNALYTRPACSGYDLSPSGASGEQRGVCGRLGGGYRRIVLQSDKVMSASACRLPYPGLQGYQAPGHSPRRQSGEPGDWQTDLSPSPFSRSEPSERCHCHGLDVQQKSPVGVDMPQPYSRKGLRGWMSTVSTRFPYKERRVGKITEIGLTRSSSTPLTPTGSRAEACQPLRVIRAAWQGRDHGAPGRLATAFRRQ